VNKKSLIGAALALLSVMSTAASHADVGSAFTYQGRLDQDGQPVDGFADLQFRLFDAALGGNQIGATVVLNGTSLEAGLFTVTLDFGVPAFSGQSRWLEVTVDGVTLAPRQAVTPVPYAMQTRGLFVDGSGQVGVGTTAPAARLDVQGAARAGSFELGGASVRLHQGPQSQLIPGWDPNANASAAGAFLEAAATVGSHGGLYVDGNVAAFWSNGDDLLRLYNSATLPAGAPRFVVDGLGRVGIGTADPAYVIDAASTLAVARLTSTNAVYGSVLSLRNNTSQPTGMGAINFENSAGLVVGQLLYVDNGLGVANDFMRFTSGQVAVADLGPSAVALFKTTTISESNFQPLNVTRFGSDGVLVNFIRESVSVGSISVAGGVVSYNAFTGSHHAWTEESLERGELLRMTGENRTSGGEVEGEVVYGVRRTTEPNDQACLGAYFGLNESTRAAGADNPHLVMAEGNGVLWVVDTGSAIEPGDALISADVPGCAMLDDPARFPIGHIVARAAERVEWSAIQPERGVRRARISVLFGAATRDSRGAALDAAQIELESQLGELRSENQRLSEALLELAEIVRRQGEALDALPLGAAAHRVSGAAGPGRVAGSPAIEREGK
jgi:transposase-like protein